MIEEVRKQKFVIRGGLGHRLQITYARNWPLSMVDIQKLYGVAQNDFNPWLFPGRATVGLAQNVEFVGQIGIIIDDVPIGTLIPDDYEEIPEDRK